MKCLVFRSGVDKQEEKKITYWRNSGRIKMLDTAERLREMEKEEAFALLFLNKKAQKVEEFVFNTKTMSN